MIWTTLPRSDLSSALAGWRGGTGPELLLIHGVGMRADFWMNLIPLLEQHFSLTVIDLPGHGHSALMSDAHPELDQYTDVIAAFLSGCGSKPIIVGHSMGALIALDLAVRYADYVQAIAVLNGVYRRSVEAIAAIQSRVTELSSKSSPDTTKTLLRWFGEHPSAVERSAKEACYRWLAAANAVGYRQAYNAFANADAPDDSDLAHINCPALFMTGSLEPNSTPAMSQAMSDLVPDARCLIVENAKHMMSMTHGHDVSRALVANFGSLVNRHA